jgi:Na+-translocating ferredoxin:NAD+ oxidoreductase RnfG subunit
MAIIVTLVLLLVILIAVTVLLLAVTALFINEKIQNHNVVEQNKNLKKCLRSKR